MNQICSSDSFITLLSVVGAFLRLLIILVVIGAIIFSMIDLFKAVTSSDSNYSPLKIFGKRLIALIILFLVPSFVRLTLNIIDFNQEESCVETVFTVLFNARSVENDSLTCEGGTLIVAEEEVIDILSRTNSLIVHDGTNYYCLGGYFE